MNKRDSLNLAKVNRDGRLFLWLLVGFLYCHGHTSASWDAPRWDVKP